MSGLEETPTATRAARLIARAVLVVLSVFPFVGVHNLAYVTVPGSTGFIQYDMPYYVANGREIFERGNGLTYPNPYDTDPEAPAVYIHWLLWLLGFGVTQLHLDPGLVLVTAGVAGALGYAWVTLRIVEILSADRRSVTELFLLAMWGGGSCLYRPSSGECVAGARPVADAVAAGTVVPEFGARLVH